MSVGHHTDMLASRDIEMGPWTTRIIGTQLLDQQTQRQRLGLSE